MPSPPHVEAAPRRPARRARRQPGRPTEPAGEHRSARRARVSSSTRASIVQVGDVLEPYTCSRTCAAARSSSTTSCGTARRCSCSSASRAARPATSRCPTTATSSLPASRRPARGSSPSARRCPSGSSTSPIATRSRTTVASDRGNELARRLGISYVANEATQALRPREGRRSARRSSAPARGSCRWRACWCSTRAGSCRFVDVTPDWMARTDAEPVLEAVNALVATVTV